ncbi:hypothetical protein [Mycolicibacterium mengxianglii]|uniref:hypothetical protein n=1 Tax=Mycolicibacterium mengxianglii TaxID=2736649 RepID=UPI0018D17834|nr:hypothetical protein [Mycolicibacterium mengxianglii]
MNDSPYGVKPGGPWQPPIPYAPPGPPWHRPSRIPLVVSVVGVPIAIALAAASWFRASGGESLPVATDSSSQHSEQEVAAAKKAICDARNMGYEASAVAGNKTSDDPNIQFVIAVNVRLSSIASAEYLQLQIDKHPAAPPALAAAARDLALAYTNMTLFHLSDASDEKLKPAYAELDAADAKVIQACK